MSSNLNFKLERQAIIQILHWASGQVELIWSELFAPLQLQLATSDSLGSVKFPIRILLAVPPKMDFSKTIVFTLISVTPSVFLRLLMRSSNSSGRVSFQRGDNQKVLASE